MRHKFEPPKVADTADNYIIVGWRVAVGENVPANDPLVLAETDRAEVAVPFRGTIVELLPAEDDGVNTGDAICVIEGDR